MLLILATFRALIKIPNLAELPETSFTRSISNPEAVMRRRRAQKLEKKLQQFRSKDGGPDTGGTLKVGVSCCIPLNSADLTLLWHHHLCIQHQQHLLCL